jgi:hypothetical protein
MLSKEVMGVLALGILWINTLLIAGAAWKDLWALRARRRRMGAIAAGGVGLARARVVTVNGGGGGGLLAAHRVEQVGRAAEREGEPPSIEFTDRAREGEVFGGLVRLAPAGGEVEIEAAQGAEVWVRREELARAGECPSEEAFAAAHEEARKARGASRGVSAGIGLDQEVFLFGDFRPKGVRLALSPTREGEMILSSFDPRRWIGGKLVLLALFIGADIAAAAACTLVALEPPHFGLVSKIGGALCLAFFLLVQPAGTMVRAAVQPPSRSRLGGRWEARHAPAHERAGGPSEQPSA